MPEGGSEVEISLKVWAGLLDTCPHALPLLWLSYAHLAAASQAPHARGLLLSHVSACTSRASHLSRCLLDFLLQLPPLTGKFLPCFLCRSLWRESIYLAQLLFLRQIREVTGCPAAPRLPRAPVLWPMMRGVRAWPGCKVGPARLQGSTAAMVSPRTE